MGFGGRGGVRGEDQNAEFRVRVRVRVQTYFQRVYSYPALSAFNQGQDHVREGTIFAWQTCPIRYL